MVSLPDGGPNDSMYVLFYGQVQSSTFGLYIVFQVLKPRICFHFDHSLNWWSLMSARFLDDKSFFLFSHIHYCLFSYFFLMFKNWTAFALTCLSFCIPLVDFSPELSFFHQLSAFCFFFFKFIIASLTLSPLFSLLSFKKVCWLSELATLVFCFCFPYRKFSQMVSPHVALGLLMIIPVPQFIM